MVKDAINRVDEIRRKKLEADKMFIYSKDYYKKPDFALHEVIWNAPRDCGQL